MLTELPPDNKASFTSRLGLVKFFIFSAFLVIVFQLWYLQIIKGNWFRYLSENNRIRVQKIPAPRGMIFDRTGNLLVDNRPSFNIVLTSLGVKHAGRIRGNISQILDLPITTDRPMSWKNDGVVLKTEQLRPPDRFYWHKQFDDFACTA